MITIHEKGPQIMDKQVAEFENDLGRCLPDDYRIFLLENNGGRPVPDNIAFGESIYSPTDIQIFYGINRSIQSSNLSWGLSMIREISAELPTDLINDPILPIACDSGGNFFCLKIGKDGSSDILYCAEEETPCLFFKVASSFTSFLEMIKKAEDL
jgi:hypothetical protein